MYENIPLTLAEYIKSCALSGITSDQITYWIPTCVKKDNDWNIIPHLIIQYVSSNNASCPIRRYRIELRLSLPCIMSYQDWWNIIQSIKDCVITKCDKPKLDIRWARLWKIIESDENRELYIDDKTKCIISDIFVFICK